MNATIRKGNIPPLSPFDFFPDALYSPVTIPVIAEVPASIPPK